MVTCSTKTLPVESCPTTTRVYLGEKVGVSVMMIMVVVVVVVVLLLLLLLRDVARRVLAQLCQCTLSAYRAFAPVYHPRMTTKSA